jgi:hypothetical protein
MNASKNKTLSKQRRANVNSSEKGNSGLVMNATFIRDDSSPIEEGSDEDAAYPRDEQTIKQYDVVPPITPYVGGALNAKNIRRMPTTHWIPLEDLRTPSYAIEPDEIFVSLYQEYMLGRANTYFTRINERDIFSGYYRSSDPITPITQNSPERIIRGQCAEIRSGRRPTIFVRENFDVKAAPRFFCCDSIIALEAYRRVGISLLPAAIVSRGEPRNLRHSAFETNVAKKLGDENPRVSGFHPCSVHSLRATSLDESNLIEALKTLEIKVGVCLKKLRSFHADSYEPFHYHDTLYSTLVRTRDYLAGAICLLKEGLIDQIVPLFRSLYEIHINFYVDWLAPENPWMELAYALNSSGAYLKAVEKDLKLDFSKGRTQQRAEQLTKRALLLARWLGVVKNKASFAPVGIGLHDRYYGYLSSVLHQDFREAADHANRFRAEGYQVIDEDHQRWLCQLANITVTETLDLVASDVGELP